ncbi:MAG: TetR/AcrR family transcriptional regulator [Oscillospiraceae bacterium]|nr:TetR/AcrR family transcriptional regulator [Ruminococcus sp.]MCD8346309.1 TetR/AcrR family transcriptional regulator [Oscillospiraceae bacterium]
MGRRKKKFPDNYILMTVEELEQEFQAELTKRQKRRIEIIDKCFECFCENGLERSGSDTLARYCNTSSANLFNNYFDTKDEMVIVCTARGMQMVENDFMERAPKSADEIEKFILEMPYITAELHGKKYRFMYQVYSSPRYLEEGKKFFNGVTERYTEYAKLLAPQLGIPWETVQGLIFIFVRACVHYAMFENEEYLKSQQKILIGMIHAIKQNPDLALSAIAAENA